MLQHVENPYRRKLPSGPRLLELFRRDRKVEDSIDSRPAIEIDTESLSHSKCASRLAKVWDGALYLGGTDLQERWLYKPKAEAVPKKCQIVFGHNGASRLSTSETGVGQTGEGALLKKY